LTRVCSGTYGEIGGTIGTKTYFKQKVVSLLGESMLNIDSDRLTTFIKDETSPESKRYNHGAYMKLLVVKSLKVYLDPYLTFPKVQGTYLYLIICLIRSVRAINSWERRLIGSLYLTTHRKGKQDAEVHDEDWPEHRNVRSFGKREED
jgi:hypothetical protein